MTKKLRQFAFVLALFVICLPFKGGLLEAYWDNVCICNDYNYDYVYLYRYNPDIDQYWTFITQSSPYYNASSYPAGINGGAFCASDCRYFALLEARNLCDSYSYPEQHYGYQFWWHWEDSNNDSGGTQSGFVDTGSALLMCDDL